MVRPLVVAAVALQNKMVHYRCQKKTVGGRSGLRYLLNYSMPTTLGRGGLSSFPSYSTGTALGRGGLSSFPSYSRATAFGRDGLSLFLSHSRATALVLQRIEPHTQQSKRKEREVRGDDDEC
ncbi:hypothetical protein QVD17_29564 [Tagetes erecta]|uniref:Uncharacterized protein n=1 Tax=Tagetes erecta TaxID=13708 RepID=A0AAD8K1S9_TARER|nr:hypothetical protein QVD17_29564 [Tagetes erecta]